MRFINEHEKTLDMKTKIIVLLALAFGIFACENQPIEFDDYGTTVVYFPYQTPARCLVLGKYELGFNDNDNNHRFEIGVTMTGVYENKKDRKVYFRLAPELLNGVENVKALPEEYYSIEQESPVTIPAGSIKGRIPVQLNEAFFDDTLSFAGVNTVNYVIPLVITGQEGLDSIHSGVPIVENPDRLKAEDWEILPKDYTLFGIKFMNKYQGIYLRRGVDELTNLQGEKIQNVYHAEYVERDELVEVLTSGRNKVYLSNVIRRGTESSPGSIMMELSFDQDENCTVTGYGGDEDLVSGTGKFVEDGDTWGGKLHDVIYLDYSYTDTVNNEMHQVLDTLVIRDRNVVFEEFQVQFPEE